MKVVVPLLAAVAFAVAAAGAAAAAAAPAVSATGPNSAATGAWRHHPIAVRCEPSLVGVEDLDLDELERYVLDEIESYRYDVPEDALGKPFSAEEVKRLLAEMRAALVKPEWRMVDATDTQGARRGVAEPRPCVLVADDGVDYQLYYDPLEKEFVLASGDPPETIGVRGDAVGCFMAR